MKTITNDKNNTGTGKWLNLDAAESKLISLLRGIVGHSGYGKIKVDVRIMKDGRKEVILESGKEYRFILTQENTGASADEKRIV